MITAGQLIDIDYSSNNCSVRIPVFENVGSEEEVILAGKILIQPGSFNNYKINDFVWVSFVDNKINKPLIIGKIYQGPTKELENSGGHLNIDELNITGNSASIPSSTKITNSDLNFNSINSIINEIKVLKDNKDNFNTSLLKLNYDLLKKQDLLIAGDNIVIKDNVISATGGGGGGSYVLPIADTDTLGGVKIGENINIDSTGTISVSISQGPAGKSAYEIAVEQGFIGTEDEWLASLKGEPGNPGRPGSPGRPGHSGDPGKSAYEIAVENGYVGTEEEWLASLKGEQGAQGPEGPEGPAGKEGPQGPAGQDGAPGADGQPGPQGEPGTPGADGKPGKDGTNGKDGEAATITVGTVTTVSSSSNAKVTNVGTSSAAKFNFEIPKGIQGVEGPRGPRGANLEFEWDGYNLGVKTSDQIQFEYTNLRGAKGETGAAGANGINGADGTNGTDGIDGTDGYTFTPSVSSDGYLSWTKSQGAGGSTPARTKIKGEKGDSADKFCSYSPSTKTLTITL